MCLSDMVRRRPCLYPRQNIYTSFHSSAAHRRRRPSQSNAHRVPIPSHRRHRQTFAHGVDVRDLSRAIGSVWSQFAPRPSAHQHHLGVDTTFPSTFSGGRPHYPRAIHCSDSRRLLRGDAGVLVEFPLVVCDFSFSPYHISFFHASSDSYFVSVCSARRAYATLQPS